MVGGLKAVNHEAWLTVGVAAPLSTPLQGTMAGPGSQGAEPGLDPAALLSSPPVPVSRSVFAQLSPLRAASHLTLQSLD